MFHPHDVKPLGLTTIGLRAPGRALQSSCCCHRSSSLPGARRGIVKHCPNKAPIFRSFPLGASFPPKQGRLILEIPSLWTSDTPRKGFCIGRLNAPEVATKQTFHHSPGLAHLQDSVERSQLKAARCVHESQPKLTAEERFGRYNF